VSEASHASKNKDTTQRPAQSHAVENEAISPDLGLVLESPLALAGTVAAQASALRRLPSAQGRSLTARIGQVQGNQYVQRVMTVMREGEEETEAPAETPTETPTETPEETPTEAPEETPTEAPEEMPTEAPEEAPVETSGGEGQGANPGGRGPGRIQHASESPYTVTGATLDDITGQLTQIDGFGAQTSAPIGLGAPLSPERQEDDTYRVEVEWAINGATVTLPQWANYDEACTAAQTEWDRFVTQARRHEQEAHVDMARDFVSELGPDDTVITGDSMADLQANLSAKQQELAGRLQTEHDKCDHGASIDAILHPDNGRCPPPEGEGAG
jgi:predicted secreted Zn-dependent protease